MKVIFSLFILSITMSAFGEEDLSKAFNKLEKKDCLRLLSGIRKRTRVAAELTDKIEKVELSTNKTSKFAELYLKLNNGQICSEQPSRTEMGTIYVQYTCRDKNGKVTLDKSFNGGPSDCTGDAPKFN